MALKKKTKQDKIIANERLHHHLDLLRQDKESKKVDKVAPNDSFVSLHNINKIYPNHVQAVYDFNLDIKKKEFIVFVGPSGCGKSTTLRMIAGLEDITSGDLFIDQKYSNDTMPKDRDIAMVFQSYALYPHMTVYDNMAFGLTLRKIPSLVIDENKYKEKLNSVKSLQKELFKVKDDLASFKLKGGEEEANKLEEKVSDLEKSLAIAKEELHKIQNEPLLAIDNVGIKNNEREIKKLVSFNKYLEKEIDKNNNASSDKKKQSKYSNLEIEDQIKVNNQKIEKLSAQIEYLKSTPVAIYKNRHYRKNDIKEIIEKTAKTLDLSQYLDRKPAALSGGQRQRVALGRAIVRNAKLFLMDEPLSNLDAKLRVTMRSEIVKLHRSLETTTIYVTHDQTEAMTMADRIVVMSNGYIQQIDTPKKIYNYPANIFVATFIGSPAMNIIDVTYDNGTLDICDEYKLELGKDFVQAHDEFIANEISLLNDKVNRLVAEIEAFDEYRHNIENGKKPEKDSKFNDDRHYEFIVSEKDKLVELLGKYKEIQKTNKHIIKMGIRPEDIIRHETNSKHLLSKPFDAKVDVPELLGHEYYIHFNLGPHKLISKLNEKRDIATGDELELAFNMKYLHIFDILSTKLIK